MALANRSPDLGRCTLPVPGSGFDRFLLTTLRRILGSVPLCLRLGSQIEDDPPVTTPVVQIRDRRTILALVANPEVAFGDAFSDGRLQVDGDLISLLEDIFRTPPSKTVPARILSRWLQCTQSNTREGSRNNIHRHYDLSNDFYKLWLDQDLIYTCAYFPEKTCTLEAAQSAKLDLVCRKLRLKPGERVVEAGCGWGALALHMAKHYGVKVRAFNISHEQIELARHRAWREGLSNAVEFIEDDYRNIKGTYDAFVSVGMLEHVGKQNFPAMADVIQRTVGKTGRGFLHFIGRTRDTQLSTWIRKRIFPGGHPPSLRNALAILEQGDFSVLDIENLRQHYALTLEHWLQRFDASHQRVCEMFDEKFARMWRLYLSGSIVGFKVGTMQLFQIVFAGRECKEIPWTRESLYTRSTEDPREDTWIHAMSS
jgi:cyclopropane-fatty-acyl-phospholipid synthase